MSNPFKKGIYRLDSVKITDKIAFKKIFKAGIY